MRWAWILVLALPCCGAEPDSPLDPAGCGVVLSPDPELADVTRKWAADWSVALPECDIRLGESGIPVYAAEDLTGADGERRCGQTFNEHRGGTFSRALEVRVDTTPTGDCAGWGYTLGHEIGHALGVHGHVDDETSLLSNIEAGRAYTLDAVSIAFAREQLGLNAPE